MVSVIILSYNTKETTLKCLKFLGLSRGVDFETIVVDNASADGSAEAIAEAYPKVRLIRNMQNAGFAAANNQGMKETTGELLLLLNSDCFVFEDTLAKAVAKLDQTKWDVLGCQLLNPDGTLQPSWGFFPTLRRIAQMMIFIDSLPIVGEVIDSMHVRSELRYQTDKLVDWVTGAWVMVKREVWEKVGGIDEKYFMYGEESEWMYRMSQAGFKVGYSPAPRAVHLVGASSVDRAPAVVGEMQGWLYWWSKHKPVWQQKVLPIVIMLGCALRIVLKPSLADHYRKAFTEIQNAAFGRNKK